MKKTILLLALSIFAVGCACKKPTEDKTNTIKPMLSKTTWELEYISGPRITFEGLYPEEKPTITINESEKKFGGNSSCNVYSGEFTLKNDQIHFGDVIKTMRFCEGGGETTFLNTLGKVNKYAIDEDGKLVFSKDDVPMMRFKIQQ